MKTILILCAVFYSSLIFGQANLTCSQAIQLCNRQPVRQDFYPPECTGTGPVKLYYYFSTSTSAGGNLLSVSTSINSTVNLYGSYNTLLDGCGSLPATPMVTSSGTTSHSISATTVAGKFMVLEVIMNVCKGDVTVTPERSTFLCNPIPCEECIPPTQFPAGTYVLSGWVKEDQAALSTTTYANTSISISLSGSVIKTITPQGQIIDGWQRLEDSFTIGVDGNVIVNLINSSPSKACFFDDIRIFPVDGSMMSYVYDPVTLRLVAELDERNYAKIYEYDEEGKLIRVKKETESGISTIQESRNNNAGNE